MNTMEIKEPPQQNQELEQLRRQTMLNHLMYATGCNGDEGIKLLNRANWNFELAKEFFDQDLAQGDSEPMGLMIPGARQRQAQKHHTPMNTPATPPKFADAFAAFQSMRVQNDRHKDQ
eukprot:Clim_evm8s207 gene=Clim_evmTU8s207